MSEAALRPELLDEQCSAERLLQELRVPRDLACWPGHFPGAELVPGVLQLDWVMQALGAWLPQSGRLAEIAVLKFKAFLLPGQEFRLELLRTGHEVQFQLFSADAVFAVGRLLLEHPAP